MTTAADRLATEQLFHDRQAADRAATLHRDPASLVYADDDYLGRRSDSAGDFNPNGRQPLLVVGHEELEVDGRAERLLQPAQLRRQMRAEELHPAVSALAGGSRPKRARR